MAWSGSENDVPLEEYNGENVVSARPAGQSDTPDALLNQGFHKDAAGNWVRSNPSAAGAWEPAPTDPVLQGGPMDQAMGRELRRYKDENGNLVVVTEGSKPDGRLPFGTGGFDPNDIAASASDELRRGVVPGILGLPGNLADIYQGLGQFGDKLTGDYHDHPINDTLAANIPDSREMDRFINAPAPTLATPHPEAPPRYQTTSTGGEMARTATRYSPGLLLPEGVIPTIMGAAADETAGQTARALGATPEQEQTVRGVAGVAGGFLRPTNPIAAEAPIVADTASGGFTVRAPGPPPAAPNPGSLAATVQDFEGAGVNPSLAASGSRTAAGAAKLVSENAIAGGRVRAATTTQLEQAQAEAQRIAGQYGTPRPPNAIGEEVSQAGARFANDPNALDSFKAKAEALYETAFNGAPATNRAAAIPGIPNEVAFTVETDKVLGDILNRVSAPRLAEVIKNPRIERIAAALKGDAGDVSFDDLRALRTWVREQRSTPQLTDGIGPAQLKAIERALTTDINVNAERLGGPAAAARLRRADQFYARGQARIERALQPLQGKPGESVYNSIQTAASSGASADIRRLNSIKRSLRPEEWGDVAATVIDNMGNPTAGATGNVGGNGFSINTFVTNYNKMSPQGRAVLFGNVGGGGARSTALMSDLDRLARVADKLKAVEAQANMSRSGINAQNLLSGGGLLNAATFLPTAKLLAAMATTGEAMSNPAVVRWMVRLSEANTPAAFNARLLKLQAEGAQSPALAQLAQRVADYQAQQDQPTQ